MPNRMELFPPPLDHTVTDCEALYDTSNNDLIDREVGIDQFNLAPPGGNHDTPEMRPLTAYVLPNNFNIKPILNYFKRGARLHINGLSVRIILRI